MLEFLPESIGQALVNQRAGMDGVVYNQLYRERALARFDLHSGSFMFNARLPRKFTADGDGMSPPLIWGAGPDGTQSFALIVEDADSPTPHPLVHAIVVDVPPDARSIQEGALTSSGHPDAELHAGKNSYFRQAWLPPDPPRGHGVHRYVFQMFALGVGEPFSAVPGRREFIEAMLSRAIGVGCLIGTYERGEPIDPAVSEEEPARAAPFIAPDPSPA